MSLSLPRCLVSLAALLFAASLHAGSAEPPMRSASEYDYPPLSVVTPDGRADGFAVELLRASLRAMGREVEFKVGPWHAIKDDLAAGRIQVLPLVARNPGREAQFDFSVPYLAMHGTIVVRKGERRIRTAGDLQGKKVVVLRADVAEEYVRTRRLTNQLVTTDTLEQGLRDLEAGHHDAMVVQKLAGESLI